jgi:hypothetical protein
MFAFAGLTCALLVGVLYFFAKVNQQEVLDHWDEYNKNLLFVFFLAPFYKPDGDPRSRLQFAVDNFNNLLSTFATDTMKTIMQPVMQIFKMLTDAIDQTVSGLFNVRGLLKSMWSQFNSMTEVFMNRFQGTLTALRATFMKLHAAIGKTFAIAVAGIMSGLSALQTMLSMFDLVVNVCITILIIVAAIFIWLPFIFLPVLALIIMAVVAINELPSEFSDQMTGIAGVFCFAEGTEVETNTSTKPIESIQLGETLVDGGEVKGVLTFDTDTDDMYDLYGVHVSGSHIIHTPTQPMMVQNHPDAIRLPQHRRKVYCFITTTRRIPVKSMIGTLEFADWEELENDIDDLREWNKRAFALLNPQQIYLEPNPCCLMSEAGFTGKTHVMTALGPTELRGIIPGCTVIDASGKQTLVRGVVRLAAEEVTNAVKLSESSYMSSGNWTKVGDTWLQQHSLCGTKPAEEIWYQLFTESGTFTVIEGGQFIEVRDFTDVGSSDIHKTYDWVLETLATATEKI